MNIKLIRLLLLLLSFQCYTNTIAAQDKNTTIHTVEGLRKIFEKNIRSPREMAEKKEASFFALKFVFASKNKLDSIIPSKYTPKEVINQVTNQAYYKDVNWGAILNKDIKKGDALIVPIYIRGMDDYNDTTFHDTTLEDAFNFFNYTQSVISGYLLQPIVVKYGPIIK